MRHPTACTTLLLLALGGCASPNGAQPAATQATAVSPSAADPSLTAATTAFVDAFNQLDDARFTAAWAEDATIFFPGRPFPARRIQGRAEVTRWFLQAFASRRERGGGPLSIRPQETQVQRYGDTAVVSFQLDGDDDVGRRTLVMRRIDGRWLIVHMHASSVPDVPA